MEATEMQSTGQRNALPDAWIDRLFQRFAAAYGTEKFTALWRTQDMAEVRACWARELAEFTRDELARAVAALPKAHPSWPPSLYEFAALCRPAPAAISHESAFYEAVRGLEDRKQGRMGNWSTKAVYWAAVDVSAHDIAGSTWPQIRSRWTAALDARMADGNLPAIPEPPKQLPAPERIRNGEHPQLDAWAALVAGTPRVSPRAWVQKILDRKAANDPMLTDIAYRMALESENVR